MRKLFISFNNLVGHLADGRIQESDLATGLFYFGCARSYVIVEDLEYIPIEAEMAFADRSQSKKLFAVIRSALLRAEEQGRIAWREDTGERRWSELSALCARNGINGVCDEDEFSCTHQGISDMLQEENIQLDVVWRR